MYLAVCPEANRSHFIWRESVESGELIPQTLIVMPLSLSFMPSMSLLTPG